MESSVKFKPGDDVVCVESYLSETGASVVAGRLYKVYDTNPHWVRVRHCGFDGYMWSPHRFVLQSDYARQSPTEPQLTGGSSDYYKLPPGTTDIMDLIEHKDMGFSLGNIFKAVYRLGDKPGTTQKYDLEKIIYFAQRELDRLQP